MKSMLLLFLIFFTFSAHGGPGITYHGRILKPDGTALENSSVQFLIQVRSPGSENCLMYEETQTKDMASSKGIFALTLDDGTGTRTDTPTYTLDRIFSNRSVLTFDTTRCTTGSTYTPASGDKRKFIVYFKDSTMSTWEPMPIMSINYVPMAMASIEAEQVGAFGANHLIRAVDGSGNPATAPALTPAQLTEFNALIGGTSSKYITSQTTAGAAMPTFTTAAPPASPVAGSIWFDTTSAELKYYDGISTQTLGNAAGTSPTGAAGGDLSGTYPNPTIANLAVTNAKVAAAAAIARSKFASGTANRLVVNDASGVMTDAAAITASRALASDANGIPVAVATTATELGYVNGVTSAIQTQLNSKISPSVAPTTAGQVLRYDGTNWTPNFVAMTDIRSTVTGSTAFASSGCAANETLSWNSVGDILTCQSIGSLAGSAISSGTVAAARLGSGTADNTTYLRGDGTWVTAPADATKLPLAGGTMTGALTINKTGSDAWNPLLTIEGDGEPALSINSSSAFDYYNPILSVSRSRGSRSAKTSVASGDTLFELWIGGYDGANNISAARMAAVVDGTPGTNDMPTRLEFHTQVDGSSASLEGTTPEMVIKNNGNVGIGLASPTSLLHLQKTGTAGGSVSMLNVESEGEPFVTIRSADNSGLSSFINPLIATYKSRGTLASPAVVQSGDTAFEMYMLGYDGSADRHLALISAYVDGTPGANDMPGRIEFHTQPDGSGASLEGTTPEMVIKNNGNVGIGTSSPAAKLDVAGPLFVNGNGDASSGDIFVGGGGWPYSIGVGWADGYNELYINAVGTGGGTADFRNLGVLDGKSNMIGFFEGSTKRFSVGNADVTPDAMIEVVQSGATPMLMMSSTGAANGDMFMIDSSGNVGIGVTNPGTKLQVAGVISPSADNAYTLGDATHRFSDVYSVNAANNTSDLREKKEIHESDLGLSFITKLRPVSYYWKSGIDKTQHYGLIAQETEKAVLGEKNQTTETNKPAIVTYDKDSDRYGIRYTELIAPVIKAIQELYTQVMGHERDLASVKRRVDFLEARNAQLEKENAAIKSYLCSKDPSASICD